jgi:hypothetical protein
LQPRSFTDEELDYAIKDFPGAAVGGFSEGTVGGEGWCVLVDGKRSMKAAAEAEKDDKQESEKPAQSAKWF